MESASAQSMLEILNECLKNSNLETVTKAELRKTYLEKTGLSKLSHKDKKLFASAVNTAYLNLIGNKTTIVDSADESKICKTSDDEIKNNNDGWELTLSSSSEDAITPANIKENVINDQFMNSEIDVKETSVDEIKENGEHEKLIKDSSVDNSSHENIQENNIDDQVVNGEKDIEMESSSDFDQKSLVSNKNNIKKSPLASTLNGFTRQNKRALISSSEDETFQHEPKKGNKVLKKARKSSEKGVPIKKLKEQKNVSKSIKKHNSFKNSIMESSDSEDEPLNVYKKNSNSISGSFNSLTKSNESESECLSKCLKKQLSNPVDSEDESVMLSTQKKSKIIESKNHSSDSEDEPLRKLQKSNKSIHTNGEKMKFKAKLKSNRSQESAKWKNNSSDSEDEPRTNMKHIDLIHSDKNSNSSAKRKLNSSNKFSKSIESSSGSEYESLAKYSKKKVNNSIDSSDSEDEPLNNLSNRIANSNDSKKKLHEKILKGRKRFVGSDDDSDEQPISTLTSKSDALNSSLKSVKNSNDSDDEPLNNFSNKKTDHSNNFKKVPVEKIVKANNSVKKSIKNNKSEENTLKKKRSVNADDTNIAHQKKGKSFDGKRDSLLSDSLQDEYFSNIKKNPNNSSDSDDDIVSNCKKEKSSYEQKNSLSSDSCEDKPLANIKNGTSDCSDSEDEPINKLLIKKSDKKQKKSDSGSSSFIDENDEQSSKKSKPSKRKEANDSGKGKKRPSASENKIEHLKKYLRAAGIRISNYNKLFENCKSMKAKCEKMLSLLEKEGLIGRPTLEKCKKLRLEIETKREIAELDVSNILKGGGRPKRSVCSDTTNCKREEEKSTPIKKFSRLKDIVDSEESD